MLSFKEFIEFIAALIVSLGGGAAIVAAGATWCGNLMAKKMLADIEAKHNKEIEEYKTALQSLTTKYTASIENAFMISNKQYDLEVDIYKKIWEALFNIDQCRSYIIDFKQITNPSISEYKKELEKHCSEYKISLDLFKERIDSAAPFYQESAYELLFTLNENYYKISTVLNRNKGGNLSKEDVKTIDACEATIKEKKKQLTKEIREYLSSLKRVPDFQMG